ncbi:mechanosensitive ion channel domain-containing protein [Marinicella sediminis]|uniref:Small-conductance mechanosensitive channel n=1 Tax=Marinicella sediminis TaxID=1792834 RepID=A0ABV7JBY5_9GAMM|nr:mechanosensitive ion channel family protein [Marinicella sediminis]
MRKPLIALLMLLTICPCWSQDQAEEQIIREADWKDTEQQIKVKPTVSDQAIEDRFERILKVSQRINEAQVKVTEGVLVLEGWTREEANRDWVEAAANRTEGVIAVVNDIELRNIDQWDLQPAVTEAVGLYEQIIRALPKITIALVLLLITWLLVKFTIALAVRAMKNKVHNPFVLRMTARLFAIPVLVVGIYLVLQLTGLTQLAVTVIGGTGLMGLVIGIAFKDIAENFLASILISIERPFKIGDYILVNGHEGVVQSVTTRGTVIMTLDGNHIHIPNAIIYKNTIVNVTANPNIRKNFTVGIGYDDNISEAQHIALEVLQKHDAVMDDPEPQVLVENLGPATVNLVVYFWVNGQQNSSAKVKSAVIRLVKRAFDEARISMPDEAREVVFPEGVRVYQEDRPNEPKPIAEKTHEPQSNVIEQDLSNEVDDIRKQSAANQLSDDKDNLIKDG